MRFGSPASTIAVITCILVGMLIARNRSRRSGATPRDPERTRGRLLRAAFQEMHRSGFRNADLDAILARAGVTKGALYYHFDNKEALGYAVVDEVMASDLHRKWVQPLRNAKNPIDVLVSIVQSEPLKEKTFSVAAPCLTCLKRCQVLMRDSAEGRQNFLGTGMMQSRRHCVKDRNVGWCGVM